MASITDATSIPRLGRASNRAESGRIPGLDGLLALSVGIVIFGNLFLTTGSGGFAAIGVYIFFCISGFLITRLMFLERKKTLSVNILHFYRRRFFRLFPVIATYIAIMTAFAIWRELPTPPIEMLSVLFYFTNYFLTWCSFHNMPHVLPIGIFWSLSVEEHFYIFFPLLFLPAGGRPRNILYLAWAACAIPLCVRLLYFVLSSCDR